MSLPTTERRVRVGDFDSLDFDQRYVFPADGYIYWKTTGRRVRSCVNKDTGYEFYRITNNYGKRVAISLNLFHGKVERVGEWFHVSRTPPGTKAHPNWPCYVFDYERERVYRVAFAAPRKTAQLIRPNGAGAYLMHDFDGELQRVKHTDLFA